MTVHINFRHDIWKIASAKTIRSYDETLSWGLPQECKTKSKTSAGGDTFIEDYGLDQQVETYK